MFYQRTREIFRYKNLLKKSLSSNKKQFSLVEYYNISNKKYKKNNKNFIKMNIQFRKKIYTCYSHFYLT